VRDSSELRRQRVSGVPVAKAVGFGLLGLMAMVFVTVSGERALAAGDEADEFGGLPTGPGQEETFYACSPCHSIRLVVQQGLSREAWVETIDWMVDEQEMDPLEPDEYDLILDYLDTYLNTDHRPPPPLRQ